MFDKYFNRLNTKFKQFANLVNPSNKVYYILWFVFVVIVFIGIYLANVNTPMVCDDYFYMYITNTDIKINSLLDILYSQYRHYFAVNGRIVLHILAQFFLWIDKSLFNIINSIAYVLLTFVLYFHCVGFRRKSLSLYIIINLLLWFCVPDFGQCILWVTGSANYLWGGIIILSTLLFYRLYLDNPNFIKNSTLSMLLFIPLGILAGWTNENTSIAMVVIMFLYIIYYKMSGIKIPKWSISCFIGSIIGFTVMIVAPGNFIKSVATVIDSRPFIIRIIIRLFQYTYYMFWNMPILILLLGLISYIIFSNDALKNSIKLIGIPFIYCTGIFIAIYSMVLAAYFPNRAWFGIVCFAIISIGFLWNELTKSNNWINELNRIIIVLCIPIFTSNYIHAYRTINVMNSEYTQRNEYIKSEKEKGNLDIIVDEIYPLSPYCAAYNIQDLSDNPNEFYNVYLSKYYNVNSIRLK